MVRELVEERAAADAQKLGGVQAVPTGALEGGQEHGALGLARSGPRDLLESTRLGVGGAHGHRAVETEPSGDAGAPVDLDERAVAAQRRFVDVPRDELLAYPG